MMFSFSSGRDLSYIHSRVDFCVWPSLGDEQSAVREYGSARVCVPR